MKWTLLAMAMLMLLCTASLGQMTPYSTTTTGGAPTPSTPTSPESMGLEIPKTITTSGQSPSVQESGQTIIRSTEEAAYSSAPESLKSTSSSPISTKATYPQATYPPGGMSQNSLYISYASQTVAGCNLYANLPLWMQISGRGNIWFYEWYPSGSLVTNYAGNVYSPGWYKRWFYADVPGWHILQYYCNGWSNYAYIYVNGPSHWVDPSPGPSPMPYPYPYPYPYYYSYDDGPMIYTYSYPSSSQGQPYNPYE